MKEAEKILNDPEEPQFAVITEAVGTQDIDLFSSLEGMKRHIDEQLLFLQQGDLMYVCELLDTIEIVHHAPNKYEADPCPSCAGQLAYSESEDVYFCESCSSWFSATELSAMYDY